MFGIHRNQAVEPPPEQYRSGPTQTGKTVERSYDDLRALQAYCAQLGALHNPRDYYQACYVPGDDVVAIPSRKAWPSLAEIQALREHEWAHARGWRHNDDGRGTSPKSLPPKANLFAQEPAKPMQGNLFAR